MLTHWGQDKVTDILQTIFANAFLFNENVLILIKMSLKFIPRGLINYKSLTITIGPGNVLALKGVKPSS